VAGRSCRPQATSNLCSPQWSTKNQATSSGPSKSKQSEGGLCACLNPQTTIVDEIVLGPNEGEPSHKALPEHAQAVDHISEAHPSDVTNKYNVDMQACLEAHNHLRAQHGAPPLEWDETCAQSAQMAAQECMDQEQMHHNNIGGGQGQNLFMSMKGGQPNKDGGKVAVTAWYSEIKDYDFKKPGFGSKTGHFTQLVWKGTTKVGMCKVRGDQNGMDTVYIAANYAPGGNITNDGLFEANVKPAK